MISKITLLAISIGGGLISAWTYAVTIGSNRSLEALFRPAVFPIASFFGLIGGLLVSPFVVWGLRDKNIKFAIPIVYLFSILVIITLNLLEIRFSMFSSVALVVIMLLFYRFIGK